MKLLKPPPGPGRSRPQPRRRVLAICGDTQVGLWMVRSLAMNGLEVSAVCRTPQGQSAHSRYTAGAWMLEHAPGQDGFIESIDRLARQQQVGSIMTISEGYHDALIAARDRFEPDIHLFSPPRECFDKATDKDYMARLCGRLGVPVARGATLADFVAGQTDLRYPLVLRTRRQNDPSLGRAPWKAAYATDRAQLDRLHEQVADFADNILVQEYHAGAEDHVQVLMHRGECFFAGEYIGEHHMPLAGGVTVQRVTCKHPKVIDDAVRLLTALDWQGIAGVQFHYDPASDDYIFLEINPRFIGGLPSVIMAGFHAPFLLWQTHFEPDKMTRPRYKLGLRSRILGGDANWMFAMMRGDALPPGQTRLGRCATVARFAWNTGPWTRDDTFLCSDPRPAWVDFRQMLKRLGGETFDIIGNPDTADSRS